MIRILNGAWNIVYTKSISESNVFFVFKYFQKHTPNVVLAKLVDSALIMNKNNLPNVLLFEGKGCVVCTNNNEITCRPCPLIVKWLINGQYIDFLKAGIKFIHFIHQKRFSVRIYFHQKCSNQNLKANISCLSTKTHEMLLDLKIWMKLTIYLTIYKTMIIR